MKTKNVYIIAGPNGSGKTTFARKFLPAYAHCSNFVNADLIALGLSPFGPRTAAIKAGKLVLQQIDEFAEKETDFGFETTLSGKLYVNRLRKLKKEGYNLQLYFLWIPSAELALVRIKERVKEGGHNVPADDVRRRFVRGISNFFKLYEPLLDSWMLFDNSKDKPILLAKKQGTCLEIFDKEIFAKINRLVR